MTSKAVKATLKPKTDRFTPEEITDMQRRAFKLLLERALEIRRRNLRAAEAISVGGEASDGND